MPGRLEGKVAVVTGSNSGIGRAIALGYGREGATVICANRQAESKTPSESETTNDLIVKNGGKAVFMKLTFSETESVNALVEEVVKKYGRIDVWYSNAGAGGAFNDIWAMTDEDFDWTIDINLKGSFKCMRAAAAQMMKQEPDAAGMRGRIINTCSIFGPRAFPKTAAYSASKLGTIGMIRAAAIDLAPYKITVNGICPGTVKTAATSGLPQAMYDILDRKALLGYGMPEDIVGPALLLASDEGKWMTGMEMYVDGGYTIH